MAMILAQVGLRLHTHMHVISSFSQLAMNGYHRVLAQTEITPSRDEVLAHTRRLDVR